jgi:hypothetical protein
MTRESLQVLFGGNFHVIQVNTNGITHEESLIQPRPAGNCINWVLGHIVTHRNVILKLVGKPPVWSEDEAAVYARGSKPMTETAKARPVTKILEDYARSQEILMSALDAIGDDEMKREEVGEKLTWLSFHETYHAGQIGLLRRIVGKEGMIR